MLIKNDCDETVRLHRISKFGKVSKRDFDKEIKPNEEVNVPITPRTLRVVIIISDV